MSSLRSICRSYARAARGFTIIEVMVTMALFLLITSGLLIRHAQFNNNMQIGNLAYDVALSLRQAQSYGLSVRQFEPGVEEFNLGYGIHLASGVPSNYILFADRDRDQFYDGETEDVEVLSLQSGYTISNFCGVNGVDEDCSGGISTLDIVFDRPDPDAIIRSNTGTTYGSARIVVQAPNGNSRQVRVAATGQISVE
jgi:prepilin-type N-terminal cleavage/methylation domain-containing protein